MKKAVVIIALAGLVGWAAQSSAQDAPAPVQEITLDNTTQPQPAPVARQMRITERFGRSVANIAASPFELPAQMYVRAEYQDKKSGNPFAVLGGFVEGVPMGAFVYFPWRLCAGLVDLFTLWSPAFDRAIIYPEYISFSPDFLDKTNLPLDKNPETARKK